MKHIYLSNLLIFSLLLFSCKKDKTDKPQPISFPYTQTVSVISYNVAGLPEILSDSSPEKNTYEIGKRLNPYDIVAVQEDFNYNHLLYASANHPYKTKSLGAVPLGDGLNVLSVFKISDLMRKKWKQCNSFDCLTPKGFSMVRLEIVEGVTIDLYNIHANAGKTPADQAARRSNLLQMYEYIEENSQGRAAIVLGDFNSRYALATDTMEVFYQLGFTDTWIEFTRGGVFPEKGETRLDSCEDLMSGECEKVDKILYRSNEQVVFKLLDYKKPEAEFQRDGEDLSDHIPVYSQFEITVNHP